MVWTLEPMFDGDVAGGKIDDPSGNEERRDPAWPARLQHDAGVGNPPRPADAGPDQDAGDDLVVVARRLPAGMIERLLGRTHGIDDELVDLALLLRLHPLIGIVGAVGSVAARDLPGDARRQIGDVD